MDRDLKKLLQWLGIAALIIVLANMLACTRVIEVPVPTPYVPDLLLPASDTVLGRMKCDLNGMPGRYYHPNLTPFQQVWVRVHEEVHVKQAKGNGGCTAFISRYETDRNFRLMMEAEAFCTVLKTQQTVGTPSNPTYLEILNTLVTKYAGDFTKDEVEKAVLCKPP